MDPARSTVLVIEDDMAIAEFLGELLDEFGYAVQHTTHGRSGLTLLHAARPALLILDLMLPDLSGAHLLAQLRAHEQLHDLPVILMSAIREIPPELVAQAQAVFRKPLNIDAFLQQVTRLAPPPAQL